MAKAMASAKGIALAMFRTFDDVRSAFATVNASAASSVRDVIVRTAQFMQAGDLSVSIVQRELKGTREGILTVGHVAYFGVASAIYDLPDSFGVLNAKPSDVITMASRMQYVYGKDDALKRIGELRKAKIAFAEWGKKDANGNAIHVPTVAEVKAQRKVASGTSGQGSDGKGSTAPTVKEITTFDEFVIHSITWLAKNPTERKCDQTDALAKLVNTLADVAKRSK